MNGQRLRPLGLGDIFDEGFDLYKRNFVFLLLVTAVAVVPLDILLAWVSPRLLPPIFDQFGITRARTSSGKGAVTALVGTDPVPAAVCCWPSPRWSSAASARYLETEATLGEVYRQTFAPAAGPAADDLAGGLVLDVGPGRLPRSPGCRSPASSFHAACASGGRQKPGKALGRSGALVSGYGGRVFTCLFLLGLDRLGARSGAEPAAGLSV